MNFLIFLLYYFICTILLGIIGVLIYKFYFKGKLNKISHLAEKQIDDYFQAYDKDFLNAFDYDLKREELQSEDKDNDKKIYSSF